MLRELGIVSGKETRTGEIFENLFPDFMDLDYEKPSEYIEKLWNQYIGSVFFENNSNVNGKMFEYIIATLCIRENILPFYMGAKVAFVPNVNFDLIFYTKEKGPICLSIKTSLRERYKQADLEAIALKYVHRKAQSFLVTMDNDAAKNVKGKIKEGEVIGLESVILAFEEEMDSLILDLKSLELIEPPVLKVIESNLFVTEEKVRTFFTK